MLLFAYGSSMNWDQTKRRCPSTRFVGIAMLRDHKLAFPRWSTQRKCAVAGVVVALGEAVWGVVFEIDDVDVGRLDAAEGYWPGQASNSYRRAECHVFMNGDDKQPMATTTYFAEPQDSPQERNRQHPNAVFKRLILSGARRWQLPAAYLQQLEAIEVAD